MSYINVFTLVLPLGCFGLERIVILSPLKIFLPTLPFYLLHPIVANYTIRPHNANHSLNGYRFHMENSNICFPFFSLLCCILVLNSFIGNGGNARIFTGL